MSRIIIRQLRIQSLLEMQIAASVIRMEEDVLKSLSLQYQRQLDHLHKCLGFTFKYYL